MTGSTSGAMPTPTVLRKYDRVARECGRDDVDHPIARCA